jgi:hypothetical protein
MMREYSRSNFKLSIVEEPGQRHGARQNREC